MTNKDTNIAQHHLDYVVSELSEMLTSAFFRLNKDATAIAQLEIEARIGTIVDPLTMTRIQFPFLSECILAHPQQRSNWNYKFVPGLEKFHAIKVAKYLVETFGLPSHIFDFELPYNDTTKQGIFDVIHTNDLVKVYQKDNQQIRIIRDKTTDAIVDCCSKKLLTKCDVYSGKDNDQAEVEALLCEKGNQHEQSVNSLFDYRLAAVHEIPVDVDKLRFINNDLDGQPPVFTRERERYEILVSGLIKIHFTRSRRKNNDNFELELELNPLAIFELWQNKERAKMQEHIATFIATIRGIITVMNSTSSSDNSNYNNRSNLVDLSRTGLTEQEIHAYFKHMSPIAPIIGFYAAKNANNISEQTAS